jgi:hypothetical protein
MIPYGLPLIYSTFTYERRAFSAPVPVADTCGFGKYSIDLRLAHADTLLAAGDAHKALRNARDALDRSQQPDCEYAWGKADGHHSCGVAHLRLSGDRIATHHPSVVGLQQFRGDVHISHSGVEPQVVTLWIENDWRTIMND